MSDLTFKKTFDNVRVISSFHVDIPVSKDHFIEKLEKVIERSVFVLKLSDEQASFVIAPFPLPLFVYGLNYQVHGTVTTYPQHVRVYLDLKLSKWPVLVYIGSLLFPYLMNYALAFFSDDVTHSMLIAFKLTPLLVIGLSILAVLYLISAFVTKRKMVKLLSGIE